ncbi:MAG: UDP-glucose 4-epimerase GalE [Gallionella sp.]|nr:UDP-glucose 4-epimerase GalE [Gallionella sp.]
MKILVAGGAGYIGSHMVRMLDTLGHAVVTFDDLSAGFREAVLGGVFVQGSLHDKAALKELFGANQFDAVVHFAGSIAVGESVRDPAKYYQNNLTGTLNLLDAMREHGVNKMVFSSTAAIFGNPQYVPIDEAHPQAPINPYGMTKWVTEQILRDYDAAYGLRSVTLRYFNAAGAAPDAALGERHDPETHLIPLALRAASGKLPELTVFGTDYDTPDGTCIRDYIHIVDLCEAHLLALQHLISAGESRAYNLGNGQGYSVKEVIEVVKKVTGMSVPVKYGPRRAGDPPRLVADATQIRKDWGWSPKYAALETIIEHAWQWERH